MGNAKILICKGILCIDHILTPCHINRFAVCNVLAVAAGEHVDVQIAVLVKFLPRTILENDIVIGQRISGQIVYLDVSVLIARVFPGLCIVNEIGVVVLIARSDCDRVHTIVECHPLTVCCKLVMAVRRLILIRILRRIIHLVNTLPDPLIIRKYIVWCRKIIRTILYCLSN